MTEESKKQLSALAYLMVVLVMAFLISVFSGCAKSVKPHVVPTNLTHVTVAQLDETNFSILADSPAQAQKAAEVILGCRNRPCSFAVGGYVLRVERPVVDQPQPPKGPRS